MWPKVRSALVRVVMAVSNQDSDSDSDSLLAFVSMSQTEIDERRRTMSLKSSSDIFEGTVTVAPAPLDRGRQQGMVHLAQIDVLELAAC